MKLTPVLYYSALLASLSAAHAQEVTELPEVVITGKAENLLGTAPAASKGQASAAEIAERPYLRRSEILETVPGVVTTQHAGGGKATQYFLRGFNLDHGTDFAISVDRMPINMRTHAHGQGYADLNGLMPELVERVDYVKGTYTARNGDLSTAGSANFKLWDALPQGFATAEYGEYDYVRLAAGDTFSLDSDKKLTLAGEYNGYSGPWDRSEDFARWNGFARYFAGDTDDYFSLTAMAYHGKWSSSDQVAQRAISKGLIGRFGSLDDTTGGNSQRYSLSMDWQRKDGDITDRVSAYAFRYDLDLFSNFTYFLDNPTRGDQFEQQDGRWVVGGEISRQWENQSIFGHEADYTLGLQTRHDFIDGIGLYKTERRQRFQTVRVDDVYEGDVGLYGETTIHWAPWLRTNLGLRGDLFYFDVNSNNSANSGSQTQAIVSPKFSAVLGPWKETEIYLNAGTGFHSNDARGVNNTVDPLSGDALPGVDPLVRTFGAELGVRTQIVPGLTSSLALWALQSDSELVYIGDAGTNEAGPGSRRYGIEWTNYWRPNDWFAMDSELALSHARFTNAGDEAHVPNSIPVMFSGGISLGRTEGLFGSLRARAFSGRPLEETNAQKGKVTVTLNGQVGYRTKNWEVALECLNILDRKDNDIEYYYTSRLAGERAEGFDDTHLHPAEPRMFRLRMTYHF